MKGYYAKVLYFSLISLLMMDSFNLPPCFGLLLMHEAAGKQVIASTSGIHEKKPS